MGRDETIEPTDIFLGACQSLFMRKHDLITYVGMEQGPSLDIHEELRKKRA